MPVPIKIVVLVGLPGSGKSWWAARQGVAPLSSDAMRGLLADDETVQGIHGEVFALMRHLLRERLKLGRPLTIVDATHLEVWERAPYLKIAREYSAAVEAVYFDTPVEECKRRNAGRERKVPEDAIDTMAGKLVPPTLDEGFARVTVVPWE